MPSPSPRHLYNSSGQTRGARQARTSDESDATTSKASNESDARNIRDHFAEAVRGAYWPQKGVMAAKEEDISEDIPERVRCIVQRTSLLVENIGQIATKQTRGCKTRRKRGDKPFLRAIC